MQEYGDKEMDKKKAKTKTHIVVLIDIVLSKPPAQAALPNATPPTGKIHPSVKWPKLLNH